MEHPFSLRDRVALITGSSRGIGRATAETMAALGARVVVSSRKPEACAAVVAAIAEKGGEAAAIPCDITRKEQVQALAEGAAARFGRVDILVCNAATNPVGGPVAQISDDGFDRIMLANVKSNMWLCNLLIPGMAERGGGAVVMVSSIAGLRARPNLGGYGISKAADFSLARSLALEWGPKNVRVNCIAPGLIRTDFSRRNWEDKELLAQREAATPLRRIGTPDEVGAIAAFLASPAAAFITGQIVVADGGLTMA